MELDRLTAGALGAGRWAAAFRPASYPLVRAGKYGRPAPDRLATSVRTLTEWLMLTWRPVDVETLPEIDPGPYPEWLAAVHFEAGLATLQHQHSQAAVLDSKLAVAGGVALATTALIPSALSVFALDLSEQVLERWLIIAGAVALLLAFVNSVRGLWLRTYRSLPDLRLIRELATKKRTDEDGRWSVATSVEQAAEVNKVVMKARVATVKLTYSSMLLGSAFTVAAFALHFLS